mmetsp:Transcript_49079/g.87570  ORF Transcript_49079/g.87570 Transcript_49079/m.87570 type:complete len:245 (+) Transcript_49079:390-1124(+)
MQDNLLEAEIQPVIQGLARLPRPILVIRPIVRAVNRQAEGAMLRLASPVPGIRPDPHLRRPEVLRDEDALDDNGLIPNLEHVDAHIAVPLNVPRHPLRPVGLIGLFHRRLGLLRLLLGRLRCEPLLTLPAPPERVPFEDLEASPNPLLALRIIMADLLQTAHVASPIARPPVFIVVHVISEDGGHPTLHQLRFGIPDDSKLDEVHPLLLHRDRGLENLVAEHVLLFSGQRSETELNHNRALHVQ